MERAVKYLILSATMGIGSYVPVMFGASAFGAWSLLGTLIGGIAGIYFIYNLDV